MAIKVQAKDTDELTVELEEWSLGVNLIATSSKEEKVVKIESDQLKEDHSHRTSYLNRDIKDEEDK